MTSETTGPNTSGPFLGFTVSGTAMSTMEGSELMSDAVKYDGGTPGAHDALAALRAAPSRPAGKGRTYKVHVTRDGAEVIEDYCRTVGETFAYETEPETRAEGRALLKVADRIRGLLGGVS